MSALELTDVTTGGYPGVRSRVPAAEMLDDIGKAINGQRRRRKLLVYVHVPFCTSKCTFCAWVSGIPTAELRSADEVRSRYVAALERQIEYFAPRLASLGYIPEIVYWGGGTPSMLSPDEILTVGESLQRNFDLSHVREYSVETSPETLSAEKIRALKAVGMNRLSIGVQSFNDSELRRSGRAHSADVAKSAIQLAKAEGCANLNIDLITGFPKQTPDMLSETLERTLELRPEHVTAYTYHASNGTVMARQLSKGHLADIGGEERAKAMDNTYHALASAGYGEYMPMYYSISPAHKFAGEGHYFEWEGDHIGFGSGANSVLANHSLVNSRGQLESYMASPTVCDVFARLGQREALHESRKLLLTLGLRLNYERFNSRFGFDFETLIDHPRMKALRLLLNRLHTPLVFTDREAYISPPDEGWHGGELLRLHEKVKAVTAAANRQWRGNAPVA